LAAATPQQLRHRQFAEALVQRIPAVNRTRNTHGQWAEQRNSFFVTKRRAHRFVGITAWRAATTIVTVQFAGLRVPDNREKIATDTAHVRLDQGQHRVCRNGSIYRAT